jgi:hypothetical protein
MVEVDMTVTALGVYDYTITYELLVDGAPVATETYDDAGTATAIGEPHTEIPNMTWIVVPGAGTHTYNIQVTVTGTNIATADANTRALNGITFGS